MALELFIIRHGKAEPHLSGVRDYDRRLVQRGMKEASAVGEALEQHGIMPAVVYSSSAPRALETAQLVCEKAGFPTADIDAREDIYEASIRTVLAIISETQGGTSPVLLVGHNPTLEFLGEYLLDDEVPHLATSGVIRLQVHASSWDALGKGTASRLDFPSR